MMWLKRMDAWVFSPTDARQIAGVRIGLSAVLLFRLFRHDFIALTDQPDGLYRPLSYMHAFGSMPPSSVTRGLFVTAVIAACCSLVGYRSRVALPIAVACSLVLFGMTTSLGKVMHNEALLMLCLIPLAFARTDEAWSVASWRKGAEAAVVSGWPWRVAMLLVCGAYFFAGLAKITHSGPAWVFSDNMRWILYANSDARAVPNHFALFIADHPWLSRLSGASIMAFELGFPLVLWRSALRWVFVPAALVMHAMTWFTLRLDYSAMGAVAVVTFVYWPAVASAMPSHR